MTLLNQGYIDTNLISLGTSRHAPFSPIINKGSYCQILPDANWAIANGYPSIFKSLDH